MKLLAIVLALTSLTVFFHSLGMLGTINLSRWVSSFERCKKYRIESTMIVVFSALLLVHYTEMALWACSFYMFGALDELSTAIYFSMTSYTTVGYGDVLLPRPWRILGPTEALVGVLMMGWSTAIVVAIVQKLYHEWDNE